ncbi:MAG: O-methyltransferase [Planctomycetota bacterium]|jgi:predicted O-methyltransferase YrrM
MIKRMLKKGFRLARRLFRRYKARTALKQLSSHENPKLKAIGHALHESLTKTMSAEEQELIRLIEERRSFLLRSDKEIAVIDYGAGSPNSERTKENMEKGVRSTALVASICRGSKSAFWATILFKLIRKLEVSSCVELGACVGISASYQAAALSINRKGYLVTLEGSPEIAKIAEETLEGLNLRNASVVIGPFHKTLKGVLESSKPIEFFFNDGHHDHDAVIQYFNEAMPYLSNEAVMVFDDISWSPGMRKAWTEIEDDERVTVSIDLDAIGIALVGSNLATKEKFRIPL